MHMQSQVAVCARSKVALKVHPSNQLNVSSKSFTISFDCARLDIIVVIIDIASQKSLLFTPYGSVVKVGKGRDIDL